MVTQRFHQYLSIGVLKGIFDPVAGRLTCGEGHDEVENCKFVSVIVLTDKRCAGHCLADEIWVIQIPIRSVVLSNDIRQWDPT